MIIKLKDGTQLQTTQEKADAVKEAINTGAIGIELGGAWFRSDYVATILPGGTEVNTKQNVLEGPDYRGVPSPAKEAIRKRIKKPHETV